MVIYYVYLSMPRICSGTALIFCRQFNCNRKKALGLRVIRISRTVGLWVTVSTVSIHPISAYMRYTISAI